MQVVERRRLDLREAARRTLFLRQEPKPAAFVRGRADDQADRSLAAGQLEAAERGLDDAGAEL